MPPPALLPAITVFAAFVMPGDWVNTPPAEGARDFANALAAAGIPAADVADAVFAAVRDRRFFVLPHPRAALGTTRARLEWMRGEGPPALDIEGALQP